MNIQLRMEDSPYEDTLEFLLNARGIEDPQRYINTTSKELIPYHELNNIDKAVKLIEDLIAQGKTNWIILVDSDADGFISASSIYRYMHNIYGIDCKYVLHSGKQHGLNESNVEPEENVLNTIANSDADLLFIPDAGTNDIAECLFLREIDMEIIILDHHEKEEINVEADVVLGGIKYEKGAIFHTNPAIVINPHVCNYSNKNLSGGAVVWKFLQALDDANGTNEANNYIDVTALSIISDSMSLKEYENRYIVVEGLKNISHPLFKAFIKKQSFSLNDKEDVNAVDCSFYIVPLINAMIRIGKKEEKELMFQAFCCQQMVFEYQKNKKSEVVLEDIYARVARLCSNTKARQAKIRDNDANEAIRIAKECGLDKDEIVVINGCNAFNKELTGLTAMKVSNYFNKPVLLGNPSYPKENGTVFISGSVRSTDEITNFKDLLDSTKLFEYLKGHQSACGWSIDISKVGKMIKMMNDKINNLGVDSSAIIVDAILEDEEIDMLLIQEIDSFSDYIANDIKETLFYIPNIELDSENMEVIGKELNTVKWKNENEVSYIIFRQKEDSELLKFAKLKGKNMAGTMTVDVVGKMKINVYNATTEPQIMIEKINIHNDLKVSVKEEDFDVETDSLPVSWDDDEDDWG